jgi:Ca-activated chloride channel family protein
MRSRIAASVVVVFVLAALVSLGAVDPRHGDLTGTVVDASGAALPGVTVAVNGPERRSTVTNGRGEFAFVNLLPGVYEVEHTLAGFSTLKRSVTVKAGATQRANAELRVGSLAETVVVAEVPVVDVQSLRREAAQGGVPGGVVGGVVGGLPSAPPPTQYQPSSATYRAGPTDTESYAGVEEHGLKRTLSDPLSTFSIDVDTASYANVRRFLSQGTRPPADAVRIEEMLNYFRYDYARPSGPEPFSITTELAECPWNPQHRLALVGIQGRELDDDDPAPRNLVFLIDVSGSMQPPDRLPLVRTAMRMLVDTLTPRDRVAIVVYAGASGVVLPSTRGDRKETIHQALANLEAGGSTNGGAGIALAYQIARHNFIDGGVNRVVLATDGDFNVGVTSQDDLVRLIERERASGVFLSVLGVGRGNLKDSTLEKLADKGNGNYAYLDSLHEARKVLVREAGATLTTIAKDVKIQVEFNPRVVGAYRLIGYENRMLRHEDFNDDRKDAGEIGAGHSVTALYEIVPPGIDEDDRPSVDPLKYQRVPAGAPSAGTDEVMTVKVRYKAPDGDASRLVTTVLRNRPRPMTANLGFASAVAELGMLLRDSPFVGRGSYESVVARARAFRRDDPEGYRVEFVRLAELAGSLRLAGSR